MKSFRFKKIDAFTGAHSPGNPAGCVYVDSVAGITDAEMLEIARQLKGFVSEVAYIFPEGDSFFLRFYSSEREVDFCGHATIAAMFDLFSTDDRMKGKTGVEIRVGKNTLAVMNELKTGGGVFTAAPDPKFLPMEIPADEITRVLGIETADLDSNYEISLVNSGLNSLLLPMKRASKLTDIQPEMETLANFCAKHGVDIIVPFTDDRIIPGSDYRTRVFAPRFGYLEDPATGSGNAALGWWLLESGIWKGGALTIEQGKSYKNPNIVRLRTIRTDEGHRVLFGGSATVRIDGKFLL